MKQEDHVHEFRVRVGWVDRRVGAGDANAVICKDSSDFGDHAGAVGNIETHVIGGGGLTDRKNSAGFAIGQEATVAGGLFE